MTLLVAQVIVAQNGNITDKPIIAAVWPSRHGIKRTIR